MRRKETLCAGEVYHIFSKTIADFKIFNNEDDYLRMKYALRYYQIEKMPFRFSRFMELPEVKREGFNKNFISLTDGKEKNVQIIAYCFMPTHIHLVLKQLKENGISVFMGNILNSYSRYFNTKHRRKGPLWEGKFKNVRVESDEQLLHLTRYIHLNPVTAYMVNQPENWSVSSYQEYLSAAREEDRICNYNGILSIESIAYKKFVEDRISYQRELAKIKNLMLE